MMNVEPTVPQRRRFGLFLLSAYRELRSVYPGGFESFLVAMSAAMGNRHTGRPINVSSISQMTGIPRPTVIRKLHLLEELGLASRTETSKGTMIYMSPESWQYVRPHVERLLELESELVLEEGPEKDKPRKDRPRKDRPRKDRPRKDRPRKDRH